MTGSRFVAGDQSIFASHLSKEFLLAKYRFDPSRLYDDGRTVQVADLNGLELVSGQEFDPADAGVPGWKPEPYPHPLFLDLSAPVAPVTEAAPVVAVTDEHASGE